MLIKTIPLQRDQVKYQMQEWATPEPVRFIYCNCRLVAVLLGFTRLIVTMRRTANNYVLNASDKIMMTFSKRTSRRLGNTLYFSNYAYPI